MKDFMLGLLIGLVFVITINWLWPQYNAETKVVEPPRFITLTNLTDKPIDVCLEGTKANPRHASWLEGTKCPLVAATIYKGETIKLGVNDFTLRPVGFWDK